MTNKGHRLLNDTALFEAFNRSRKGEKRLDGMPAVIGANNLLPHVTPEIQELAQRVYYEDKNGNTRYGYRAELVGSICILYSRLKREGQLHHTQYDLYWRCIEMMEESVSSSIVSLIDEACGIARSASETPATDALKKMTTLKNQLSAVPVDGMFPVAFYEQVHRVYGHKFRGMGKTQQWVAQVTLRYVYSLLPPEVQSFLKKSRTYSDKGHPKHKIYQRLTEDIGYAILKSHISEVTGLLRACPSGQPRKFKSLFQTFAENKQNDFVNIDIDFDYYIQESDENRELSRELELAS
ncbi:MULTISPECIES: P63C domain-containing protein [unclassified Vibrio]|uniref:P63C domain-containing protein n=1 Tax=unclassified Vibrio TaxID=2614977 RepID=UPI00296478DB|nr:MULTISPECIES: P63C domain-containing protein [unclassified Vibrio]MDW2263151.1 P63C domain-containing protein [Vibrio sp. 1557]MDW2326087.1 P63C domain-containing protein [Vibrio sp. 1401]